MFDSLNIYIGSNVKQLKIIATMKITHKKKSLTLLWYCIKGTKSFETSFENASFS